MSALDLPWSDLDPGEHSFDPRDLPAIVAGALVGQPYRPLSREEKKARKQMRRRHQGAHARLFDVDADLVRAYGEWARGWSLSQGNGGGPVTSWCCAGHSFTADTDATLQRIVASVREWRAYLEAMAALFGELRPELDRARGEDEAARRATLARLTVRLVREVAGHTAAEDAWYPFAEGAAAWLLESSGMPPEEARRRADQALDGKFQSWIAPTEPELARAGEALGEALDPWLRRG